MAVGKLVSLFSIYLSICVIVTVTAAILVTILLLVVGDGVKSKPSNRGSTVQAPSSVYYPFQKHLQ
jgi:hypothetical protein